MLRKDIPAEIRRAEERRPGIAFDYAWSFDVGDVARFLARRVEQLR